MQDRWSNRLASSKRDSDIKHIAARNRRTVADGALKPSALAHRMLEVCIGTEMLASACRTVDYCDQPDSCPQYHSHLS